VTRPRLVDLVDGALPALALTGPAGAGKSVAAAQLSATAERVAWTRLAPGYDKPEDVVGLAERSLGMAPSPDLDDRDTVALSERLLELLEVEPTCLVIDDYHEGDCERLDPFIAETLPLMTDRSQVILTSRTRPTGLIGRAAGLVQVVPAEMLAFTPAEAATLFADRGRAAEDAA
jgi:ATP/maltotriose-dependent transcriptional regulator MalT